MNASFGKHFGNPGKRWRSVDFVGNPPHPMSVRSLMTRFVAVVVLIVLPTSAWAQCAGWQSTAEARMECCAQEEQCPMHAGTNPSASHTLTQQQADTCCALSERAPSTPSSSSQIAPVPLALVSTLVAVVLPDFEPLWNGWQTSVSIAANPVPRHILLSVFLV